MKTFDQSDKYNRYNRLDFFFIFASMLKRKPTNNVRVQQLLFLPLNAPLKNKKKLNCFYFSSQTNHTRYLSELNSPTSIKKAL